MSKKILVDSCGHCPLASLKLNQRDVCTHEATDGMEIEDRDIIHSNCPLDENKRSCTCHD